MFLKIILLIVCAFVALAIGAELEKMFPNQPITEIWMVTIVVIIAFFGFKWAFKTDNKRALKMLSSSGYYSLELLNKMSYNELMLRERMHKKDPALDWSTYTYKQLIDLEAEEKEAKKAENASKPGFMDGFNQAQKGSKGFFGTYGKRIVCKNCGVRMMKHFGMWTDSAICQQKGIKCVPYEVPDL